MEGLGSTPAGKTNRMGPVLVVSETSSRMSPLWTRRRSIVPVCWDEKNEENDACSDGGSEELPGRGRGTLRREV